MKLEKIELPEPTPYKVIAMGVFGARLWRLFIKPLKTNAPNFLALNKTKLSFKIVLA